MVQSIETDLPQFPFVARILSQNLTLSPMIETPPPMENPHVLLIGIALSITSLVYFAITKRQNDSLWAGLSWRSQKHANANTPPRSLSPEKKVPNNSAPQGDYVDIFPPSRREALAGLVGNFPAKCRIKLVGYEMDQTVWTKSMVPFTCHFRDCADNRYTPTGISVGQIKALGDFPNYAELSGVPLPQPYDGFNIAQALPRPYRPYRWPYHQTMCMHSTLQ